MKNILIILAILGLSACGQKDAEQSEAVAVANADEAAVKTVEEAVSATEVSPLDAILAAQSEETQARYVWRHPKETLEFFDVQAGQVVLEVLPGPVWYSRMLLPLLGSEGRLIGVDYEFGHWKHFDFATEKFLERRANWGADWLSKIEDAGFEDVATAEAYTFATLPEELSASVDRVLFFRALHNMARFNAEGAYLDRAIAETARVLKPGGLVGVVQHRAAEEKTDDWADGSRGYLKASFLKQAFADAGLEFVREAEINANPADVPGDDDIVWRLPPSFYTSAEDDPKRAEYQAIGESDRMTLVFRKPE